jgi:hypothetical protein
VNGRTVSHYRITERLGGGAIIPAVEPRFKAVILASAGLASGRAQPEVDQINFVTHVRQPVLMLNGRFDAIELVDTAQGPLFDLLVAWLDRYVGPVK